MILPHPESDLNLNLMVVGADIVEIVKVKGKQNNYVLIETVLTEFLKRDNRRTPDLFIFSLVFLFAIGLVERKDYRIKLVSTNQEHKQKNGELNLFS